MRIFNVKPISVVLALLLITAECFGGARVVRERLKKNLQIAERKGFYNEQTLARTGPRPLQPSGAPAGEPAPGQLRVPVEERLQNLMILKKPEISDIFEAVASKESERLLENPTAASGKSERLVDDPVAARQVVDQVKKGDPKLAEEISKDIAALRRYSAVMEALGGFTAEEIKYSLKEGAKALPKEVREKKVEQEREDTKNVSNELMATVITELGKQTTWQMFDSSFQKSVTEHQPAIGERITYDQSSSQLEFVFDSPEAILDKASVNVSRMFDRYQQWTIEKEKGRSAREPTP